MGFSPSESLSWGGWRAKSPALSTGANVNTAIPSQLETLNALDSVHYQGRSVQLMQLWSPLAASDGWDGEDVYSFSSRPVSGSLIGQVGFIMEV